MRRLLNFKLLITGLILGHFTLGTVSCDKDNDDPEPKDNTEQEKNTTFACLARFKIMGRAKFRKISARF